MSVSPSVYQLTGEEQRQIVTPYAFGVSEDLIGTPLATPRRRAIAMIIDLMLVSLLTNVSSLILAFLAAMAFWKAGNKTKRNSRFPVLRKLLRLFAAFLLFVVAVGLVDSFKPTSTDSGSSKRSASLEQVITAGAYLLKGKVLADNIASGKCQPALTCWQDFIHEVGEQIARQPISQAKAISLMNEVIEQLPDTVTGQQRQQLRQTLTQSFNDYRDQHPVTQADTRSGKTSSKYTIPRNEDGDPSLVAWIRGIVGDLGIGFGWAALYFTAFSAWWQGQTPGKRAVGIQIVKLNGQPMSWWESFERYGGYTAGFATGLLGFFQVYWDPNRQAIHDKIGSTLVIRGRYNPLSIPEPAPSEKKEQ